MAQLSDFLAKLKARVPDTALRISDADKNNFILAAVDRYSKDRPLLRDNLLTGDGTAQEFATPSDWVDDFSTIKELEFPVDDVPPTFFQNLDDDILVVQKANVEKIQLITITLQAAETARIFYIANHLVDATSSTVRAMDEDAVADLAASMTARALAAFYAESTDDTHNVDVVDHANKAALFTEIADNLEKQYAEHIEKGNIAGPILTHSERDVRFSWGQDLLTHPKRHR